MTDEKVPGFVDVWVVIHGAMLEYPDQPGMWVVLGYLAARQLGVEQDEWVQQRVDAAFRRIVQGEPADKALKLRPNRRGPRTQPAVLRRNLRIVTRLQSMLKRSSSPTVERAIADIAREMRIGEDTVRAIYKVTLARPRSRRKVAKSKN